MPEPRITQDPPSFAMVPRWLFDRRVPQRSIWLYAAMGAIWANRRKLTASEDTMADHLGCSVATIKRAMAPLERIGALRVHRTRSENGVRRVNEYELVFDDPAPWRDDPDCKSATRHSSNLQENHGSNLSRKPEGVIEPEDVANATSKSANLLRNAPESVRAILQAVYSAWNWRSPRVSHSAQKADIAAAQILADAGVTPEHAHLAAVDFVRNEWNRRNGPSVKRLADQWEQWAPPDDDEPPSDPEPEQDPGKPAW